MWATTSNIEFSHFIRCSVFVSDSESQNQDIPTGVMRKRSSKLRASSSESSEFSESSDTFSDISMTESDDSSDEEERIEMDAEEFRNEFLDAIDMVELERYVITFLIYRKTRYLPVSLNR